ncbi:hypothetical protein P3T97_14130 (plasmid) [Mammaliicoccus sciuri]|uniref:hypothetical protein n=1 Tax=Mammaliicoccus sciuri TaxID=1296 RepID=UPI002B25D2BF|nr:hypothetical protein [Mammaliicoccus sciuri]WQJ67256.1 hypothetical protein P3T97_14130 [Mammaliicoccus sciuri]
MYQINRNGEININGNELEYFAPVTNFRTSSVDSTKLKDSYEQLLDKLNYSDSLAHINDIRVEGKYIYFEYIQQNTTSFNSIRTLPFEKQLQYFRTLISLGNLQKTYDMQILWKTENIILSHDDHNEFMKAVLYEFDDFKVYDNTDELKGVKKLILSGLTKINNITGKPTRADFINKDNEVIEFAEEVLQATSLEDLDIVIQTRLEVIEKEREAIEQKQLEESQNKKKGFMPFKRKKSKPKELSTKDYVKNNLISNKNSNEKKGNNKLSINSFKEWLFSSPLHMGLVIFIIIIIVIFINSVLANDNSDNNDKAQKSENKTEKQVASVYREYINGDKNKAKSKFSAMDYKKLNSKEDKKIYIKWLLEDEKYTKALKLDDNVAYNIGKDINDKNINDIKKISEGSNNKVLSFFIAGYQKDFQTQIELKDSVNLKDEDVVNSLAKAFYLTNQEEEFNQFVDQNTKKHKAGSKISKNLNSVRQTYSTSIVSYDEAKKEVDKSKKEVDNKSKDYEKAKKKDKDSAKKDLEKAQDKLKNDEERANKIYNDILSTSTEEAIQ